MAVVNDLIDVQQMPLYDTLSIATTTAVPTLQYMFTEPISATKGRNKTNLTSAGRLEAPKSFRIQAIRVVFSPNISPVDAVALYENYILRLVVGDKDYQIGGLEFFPGGAGLSSSTTLATVDYHSNGVADPRAINVLEHPVIIGQGENFRVELEGTTFTTAAAVWLRVYLDGVIGRQVQ